MQQLIGEIKKQKKHQNRHLREQKLDRINIRRMPNYSRIGSEQPEKENIHTKQTNNKPEAVGRNDII